MHTHHGESTRRIVRARARTTVPTRERGRERERARARGGGEEVKNVCRISVYYVCVRVHRSLCVFSHITTTKTTRMMMQRRYREHPPGPDPPPKLSALRPLLSDNSSPHPSSPRDFSPPPRMSMAVNVRGQHHLKLDGGHVHYCFEDEGENQSRRGRIVVRLKPGTL